MMESKGILYGVSKLGSLIAFQQSFEIKTELFIKKNTFSILLWIFSCNNNDLFDSFRIIDLLRVRIVLLGES